MNYSSALKYLFSFINFERLPFEYKRQFNLKRVETLLSWFGNPHHFFSSVLVAGTKGKGSTANFLASILTANGYSTGFYSSPHLNDPRERIRINGKVISERDFAELIGQIRPVIERHRRKIAALGPITFFEVFTLAAFLYFAHKKVDLAISEIGMGGRLDASNVLTPLVSVIAPISFDHEEHLGNTLGAIAREKAAVIKRKSYVVSAEQKPEARRVIANQIRKQGATGYFYGSSFRTKREKLSLKGSAFDFQVGTKKGTGLKTCPLFSSTFKIKLPGEFQIKNAALALAAAGILENRFGFTLKEKKVKKGLSSSFWPGRFEVIKRGARTFVLDGAHNGASMEELMKASDRAFPEKHKVVIFGCSREKNLEAILKPLLPQVSYLVVTKSDSPRAQEPKIILEKASKLGYKKPASWAPNLKEALDLAGKLGLRNAIYLITGSLFLIGEAREALKCPKLI